MAFELSDLVSIMDNSRLRAFYDLGERELGIINQIAYLPTTSPMLISRYGVRLCKGNYTVLALDDEITLLIKKFDMFNDAFTTA